MKKRKGASTILVLFMVIVLITLGLFTIVSANVNYKLSKKSDDWSMTYYELDKVCETNLALVEEALLISEQEAMEKAIDIYTDKNDSDTIAADIVDMYTYVDRQYKIIAMDKLSELAASNDFSRLSIFYDEFDVIENLEYSMIIRSEEDENYEIQVAVEVKDILYDINVENGSFKGERIYNESRYDIKKWKQYQNIEEKINGIEVWDPRDDVKFDIVSPEGDIGGTWNPTEELVEIID